MQLQIVGIGHAKDVLIASVTAFATPVPDSSTANDDTVVNEGAAAVSEGAAVELDDMNSRGWSHLGCISQVNSASRCQSRARAHGYFQSRIQQGYI